MTPNPTKTIDQIFKEFLADQEARLSPTTFESTRTSSTSTGRTWRATGPITRGRIDAITKARGTYCGTFGAEDTTSGFSEFLGYFMPHKVIAGNETMKAAGTVVKKLAKWLVAEGLHARATTVRRRERAARGSRDLPASQKLLDELERLAHREIRPGQGGQEARGPLLDPAGSSPAGSGSSRCSATTRRSARSRSPRRSRRACKVGWDVGGVVAKTSEGLAAGRGLEHLAVTIPV